MLKATDPVTITAQKVLDAAKANPGAKEILKTLFPEAFEKEKYFDLSKLVTAGGSKCLTIFTDASAKEAGFYHSGFFQIRSGYEFEGKGFYLDHSYNWAIEKDRVGQMVLVPTRKL